MSADTLAPRDTLVPCDTLAPRDTLVPCDTLAPRATLGPRGTPGPRGTLGPLGTLVASAFRRKEHARVSRVRAIGRAAVVMTMLAFSAVPASAQWVGRDTPRRGSFELSGGGLWTAATDQPNQIATLTRNPSTGSGAFDLFKADPTLGSAIGLQARVGIYVSSAISIEGGAEISRPELRVRLTGDSEGAADTTASETITSFLFSGSVVYNFRKQGRRMTPFVLAGAGHVRDLHEGSDLVETGLEYHAGGGLKWWLGKGRRKLGVRADASVSIRQGGFGTEEGSRTVPTAGLSLAYVF